MNERAEQLITDAGEKVLEYLEATEGFAVEQAPLLAQEIVRWGVWGNGLLFLAGIVIIGLGVVTSIISARAFRSAGGSDAEFLRFFGSLACSGVCLIFGSIGISHISAVLKAFIAPRLYILEQIGSLL